MAKRRLIALGCLLVLALAAGAGEYLSAPAHSAVGGFLAAHLRR